MADCNELFMEFDSTLTPTRGKKDALRTSRDALRAKLGSKFASKGYDVEFREQGSFAMGTIIESENEDDLYDIDDGAYIQQANQPDVTPATLHSWVVSAAKDHTTIDPKDKGPCVRVFFKAGYHVDLVVYHERPNEHPRLAHRDLGWVPSDPGEFTEWFIGQAPHDSQLRRLVRYFKAWSDHLKGDMPSGLVMTILATNHYSPHSRDDEAFLGTMKAIIASLQGTFVCYRPTYPAEDLLAHYADSRRTYFLDRLESFIRSGEFAVAEDEQYDACKNWQRHFGDRFPCWMVAERLEDAQVHTAAPFIKTDARSA